MKALMCSVYDVTISKYMQPWYANNEEDAKRSFNHILNSNDLMRNNPSDFELHLMATWDDETGIVIAPGTNKETRVASSRLFKGGEIFHEYKYTLQNTKKQA